MGPTLDLPHSYETKHQYFSPDKAVPGERGPVQKLWQGRDLVKHML